MRWEAILMRDNPPPNDTLGFVYLAQAIDLARNGPMILPEAVSRERKMPVYDPAGGWRVHGADPTPDLQKANFGLLYRASWLVAGVDPETWSLGTAMEISFAAKRGIPTTIAVPNERARVKLEKSWVLSYLRQAHPESMIEVVFKPGLINQKWNTREEARDV